MSYTKLSFILLFHARFNSVGVESGQVHGHGRPVRVYLNFAPSSLAVRGKAPKLSDTDTHDTHVLVRGLSSTATEADVRAIFASTPPRKVIFVPEPSGRPRGDVFLDMVTVAAARAAMCHNKSAVPGGRALELALASAADVHAATGTPQRSGHRGAGPGGPSAPHHPARMGGDGRGRPEPPPSYDARYMQPPAGYYGAPPPQWYGGSPRAGVAPGFTQDPAGGYYPPQPQRGYGAPQPPPPWHGHGHGFDPRQAAYGDPRGYPPPEPYYSGSGGMEPSFRGGAAPPWAPPEYGDPRVPYSGPPPYEAGYYGREGFRGGPNVRDERQRGRSRSRSPPQAVGAASAAQAVAAGPDNEMDYATWYSTMYGAAPAAPADGRIAERSHGLSGRGNSRGGGHGQVSRRY